MIPHEETLSMFLNGQAKKGRRRLMSCETPGCSAGCAYAYGCHAARTGDTNGILWPLVALGLLTVFAGVVGVFA